MEKERTNMTRQDKVYPTGTQGLPERGKSLVIRGWIRPGMLVGALEDRA
jgi:hypothetical protein